MRFIDEHKDRRVDGGLRWGVEPICEVLTAHHLEFALLEYIDWWNHRRLHGEIGMIPPDEAEAAYYRQASAVQTASPQ